jgi:hypothetical protein
VLAALRKRQFFSLAELNEAILKLVHKLNERPFRKLAGSRCELYRTIDRPALQPLPLHPFVYAEWKKARVNLDYHIELGGHYYSTPYQLVGKEADEGDADGTTMAAGESNKTLMPKPVGQPWLPHITTTPAHMKRNDGPHPMESTIALLSGVRNEMTLPDIYLPFS